MSEEVEIDISKLSEDEMVTIAALTEELNFVDGSLKAIEGCALSGLYLYNHRYFVILSYKDEVGKEKFSYHLLG